MKRKYETPKVNDQLIYKVAKYDARAFEKLYKICSSAVYALAYSIVGNKSDSDDVVQETFITIYNKAEKYVGEGKAMAWIFTITRNHALMKIRDRKKRQHVNLDDVYDIGIKNTVEADIHKEDIIRKALSYLNVDERQIVVMHAMSNIKHKEISKMMDIPLSTVLSKYRRALEKMRSRIEVSEYEKN